MELKQIMKLDINDISKLKSLGYNPDNYYGGFWEMMKYVSKAYRFLKREYNFQSIFNEIFFKHDLAYSKKPNLKQKKEIDKIMYKEMITKITIFDSEHKFESIYIPYFVYYTKFAEFCFKAVKWFTPIYLIMGKVRF